MIRKLAFLIAILSSVLVLSCSSENQDVYTKIVITSNTPDALIRISDHKLVIKNRWEYNKVLSIAQSTGCTARCDDPTVLITGELYINNKLSVKKEANDFLSIGYTHR